MEYFFAKRPVRAGEFVTANDVYTCQMIVDWATDEHGERGHDIACGRAASYVFKGGHMLAAIEQLTPFVVSQPGGRENLEEMIESLTLLGAEMIADFEIRSA